MENAFIIAGLLVACLVGYIMASDIVFFGQHGVEKQVIVKQIVQTRHGVRSTSYEYLFKREYPICQGGDESQEVRRGSCEACSKRDHGC